VRTARGAERRRDGEDKSAETGSRQVPRFGFCAGNVNLWTAGSTKCYSEEWRSRRSLCGLVAVFAAMALQDLFLLLDFVFLFGSGSRCGSRPSVCAGNEQSRWLDGKKRDGGQECDTEQFSHNDPPSRMVTHRKRDIVYANLLPGGLANIIPE